VGLKKSFTKSGGNVAVLRGVDLEVRKGETIAITGASGAGKSTLLHILGTLDRPTEGEVLWGAERTKVFALPDSELSSFRNQRLGFVFQFHYLLPEFSALENAMMPALIAGHSWDAAERQARELLKFVGMSHREGHRPSELSGGEQQRVAIARAVILRPDVLLADELTGNLDSANSEKVMGLLADLNRAFGVTIVLVTHDAELAGRMGRRLAMKDGRFVD